MPVAEHHDGFSMWASKVNPWNAKDMGPKLDLVGLLSKEIREQDMKLILSMHHAYNITGFYSAVPPLKDTILQMLYGQLGKEKNEALWLAKHKEIIDFYQPDIIWQDFNLHVISQPVLLNFLAYYYNKANEWDKEVVATYKDGLNTDCAVLDFERGGAHDVTPNYWLTDDAISFTSWCYTEGLKYYSNKQILHGFLDRISKNGNLLLNISPKADGSIPQGQKDILLAMGDWLKRYGEGVYASRAWEIFGEGPTKMGTDHGVFAAPAEGTSKDIRFTRSKDNKTLFAIMLGWNDNQKQVLIKSLSSNRIDLKNLKSVELINGKPNDYIKLDYSQNEEGLLIDLPEKKKEELAYVVKLTFKGSIPSPDRYAEIDCSPHFYIVPANGRGNNVLGSELSLTRNRKDFSSQWKLESKGKGFYKIVNRENNNKVLVYNSSDSVGMVSIAEISENDNELWKIQDAYNGFKISNKLLPEYFLSMNTSNREQVKAELVKKEESESPFEWDFKEICELPQKGYGQNIIPGIIEAEDYDMGCPGDAYYDRDEINSGKKYRIHEQVDIDTCTAGGYAIGWTNNGEWLAYTVNVKKSATYRVEFYFAAPTDQAKISLITNDDEKSDIIDLPSTGGYQSWKVVKKDMKLNAGEQVLKLTMVNGGLNFDKMIFKEIK